MKRVFQFIYPTIAAVGLTTALYSAKAVPGAETQSIAEELKAQEDPTILNRRLWSDTEWNRFKDGSDDIEETLGALWAWRVSDNQDWAVRLKVPFEFHIAGDAVGDKDEQGLGDLKLATGTAFRLGESWRVGGGLELRMPTAQEGLGDDVWKLQEMGAVAWDVTHQLSLSPSFEYNQSIAEEDGAGPQHYLEMYFPATWLLPHRWSVTARYEAKVDFKNDDSWTHSAKLVIAKRLEQSPLGFSLSVKKSFDGGNKEFQINFVTTYYFQSRKHETPKAS